MSVPKYSADIRTWKTTSVSLRCFRMISNLRSTALDVLVVPVTRVHRSLTSPATTQRALASSLPFCARPRLRFLPSLSRWLTTVAVVVVEVDVDVEAVVVSAEADVVVSVARVRTATVVAVVVVTLHAGKSARLRYLPACASRSPFPSCYCLLDTLASACMACIDSLGILYSPTSFLRSRRKQRTRSRHRYRRLGAERHQRKS